MKRKTVIWESREAVDRAGVAGLWTEGELPRGVWINSRENETRRYYFVQNYNRDPVLLTRPDGWKILVGEEQAEGIPGMGTWVYQAEK